MSLRQVLILIGIAALVAGFLIPVYTQKDIKFYFLHYRYYSSTTYVFLALALACAAVAMKKDDIVWIFGLIILGVLINDFRITWQLVSSDDPSLSWYWPLSEYNSSENEASLGWGWLLLFNGALVLAITLFLGEDRERLGMVFGSVKAFFASLSPVQPPEEEENADEPAAPDETSEDTPSI